MKIVIDENLSKALARALQALFVEEHQIIHLREKFGPKVTDSTWIRALGDEGRWIVISADRRITRNKAEYNAFRSSRLIGFFLSAGLYKASLVKQTERILALWENIIVLSAQMEGGAMFELPTRSSRIRQLRI